MQSILTKLKGTTWKWDWRLKEETEKFWVLKIIGLCWISEILKLTQVLSHFAHTKINKQVRCFYSFLSQSLTYYT